MQYVTYDDSGALTGAYLQELQPEHEGSYIQVSDADFRNWVNLQANAARDGVEPIPPAVPTLVDLQARLTAAATAKRWEVETGGLVLPDGVHVDTGTADQDRITSVVAIAGLAGVTSVDFKAASGWVTLTLVQVQTIAGAIALHVQACFSAERAHHDGIAALETMEAAEAYDVSAGWPSNTEEPAP